MKSSIALGIILLVLGSGGFWYYSTYSNETSQTDIPIELVPGALRSGQFEASVSDPNAKVIVLLEDNTAVIQKGKKYRFDFIIRNTVPTSEKSIFEYQIEAEETTCEMDLSQADTIITYGQSGSIGDIAGSEMDSKPVILHAPHIMPTCTIKYVLNSQIDGAIYDTTFFIVTITN